MRAFLAFTGLMVACLLAGALLAYPAFMLVHPFNPDWPFHRVANRVAMLLLLIGLFWLLRRLRLNDRAALGYGLERGRFIRQLAASLAIGALLMLPVMGILYALDLRVPKPGLFEGAGFAGLLFKGLMTGLVVAFIEETFLRGAMHTAIARESGARTAVILTAVLYAALHFLNRVRIPAESVDWDSGFALLQATFASFSQPGSIADSFLALFAVGLLLGLVRMRTGNIAACIGLHAGWVWVITLVRETSSGSAQQPWSILVGSYDGVVGYLVLAWTVVLGVAYWRVTRTTHTQGI